MMGTSAVLRSLLVAAVLFAALASAQELPGTAGLGPPRALRNPYEEPGRPLILLPPPPAGGPPHREPPWLVLVPDFRISAGYSDNIFITPDVLGSTAVSDGIVAVSPRLRALVRLTRELGLIGDYGFSWQQFFANGDTVQNAGTLFLGYRPRLDTHAELGARGGTATVSKFSQSNVEEGHLFLSGTYGLAPAVAVSASASVGVRDFPDRTQTEAHQLLLGIGPLVLPIPIGTTTTVHKGEHDVVSNIAGGLSFTYRPTGALRAAYDFTDNNASFSQLDFESHRLSLVAVNVWSSWFNTQLAYSASFRRFSDALSSVSVLKRSDALHDFAVTLNFAPPFLSDFWFVRSGTLHVDYDLLVDRSNLSGADFDRDFVSVGLDIGLIPITAEEIARLLPGI